MRRCVLRGKDGDSVSVLFWLLVSSGMVLLDESARDR